MEFLLKAGYGNVTRFLQKEREEGARSKTQVAGLHKNFRRDQDT